MNEQLVSLRAIDQPDEPFSHAGQAQLLARALELADQGRSQESIIEVLRSQFPGKPSENHYLNPAAEAVMRRVRKRELQRVGLEKDVARLRAEGKPEAWAYQNRGLPVPEGTTAANPTPSPKGQPAQAMAPRPKKGKRGEY